MKGGTYSYCNCFLGFPGESCPFPKGNREVDVEGGEVGRDLEKKRIGETGKDVIYGKMKISIFRRPIRIAYGDRSQSLDNEAFVPISLLTVANSC